MANWYLRSTDGNNADSGATWALAKATLASVASSMAAGDTCYISKNHSEAQGSAMTIAPVSNSTNPARFICVDDTGNPEPPTTLATTAIVGTTGAFNLVISAGYSYFYGITFKTGTGSSASEMQITPATGSVIIFENCGLWLENTAAAGRIRFLHATNNIAQTIKLINTTLGFSNTSQSVVMGRGRFIWDGGSLDHGAPTSLFLLSNNTSHCWMDLRGLDLSALTSGKGIINVSTGVANQVRLTDCKIGAGGAADIVVGTHAGVNCIETWAHNCDLGDTNYTMYQEGWEGVSSSETSIVRSTGFSDGTTSQSCKMASNANTTSHNPLRSPEMSVWNETTGSSKTLTVHIIHDSTTNLKNDEVWIEVMYMGTSGFPTGTIVNDRVALLATAADQASSSETWSGTGVMTNPNKQKLDVTFTPQEKGIITARVILAKASYTVYVDPLMVLS